MNKSLKNLEAWLRQVTTAFGAAGGVAAIIAFASGQIDTRQFVAAIVAAAILAVWPEKGQAAVGPVQDIVGDLETLIDAYSTGVKHGAAGKSGVPAAVVPPGVVSAAPIVGRAE